MPLAAGTRLGVFEILAPFGNESKLALSAVGVKAGQTARITG